jgi:hypothetical protein
MPLRAETGVGPGMSACAEAVMPFVVVAAATAAPQAYVRCGPGVTISRPRPGDIILVRRVGWLERSILAFARMWARGTKDRASAHWSHVALVVSWHGHLVEARHNGIVLSAVENYRDRDYHYVRIELPDADRAEVARYAVSCLRRTHSRWSFALAALAKLGGGRSRVAKRSRQECAALVVRALQRAGMTFEHPPADMSVADLARRFGVRA